MDKFLVGDRVRLLLGTTNIEIGTRGTVADVKGMIGVAFDGHYGIVLSYQGRDILDYCEHIDDDRLLQLTFNWWLHFGDWRGERGEQDSP